MKFDKRDLSQCNNLILALKKAKFELDGMEVLAFADMMKWVNYLHHNISQEAEAAAKSAILPVIVPKEAVTAIVEAPKAMPTKIGKVTTKRK